MTKRMIVLVGLLAASLAATRLLAQPMGPPMMMKGMGHNPMFGDSPAMMLPLVLRHANLTPDQQTQVHKIMETEHENLQALFKQLQAANDQLTDKLFASGPVQASDLTPQVQQIMQLRQQLMEQGVKTALAIRAVLQPEQLAKVAQFKDRMQKLQAEMRSVLEGSD
ncbi:MAG TPA: periplasmic heavy metal sensor [Candidatus Margulisiibacteriota bacterium]|nr:periplasmic heavy metal sensor [Candidatus Margulisiibacteriota bacterium]